MLFGFALIVLVFFLVLGSCWLFWFERVLIVVMLFYSLYNGVGLWYFIFDFMLLVVIVFLLTCIIVVLGVVCRLLFVSFVWCSWFGLIVGYLCGLVCLSAVG